jgi:hypothetical protein
MALADILQIAATLLAVILIIYAVLDFFSLAHQVQLKRERNQRLVNYLVLTMLGAFLFAASRLAAAVGGYGTLSLGLDVIALLSLVLAFYVHLRKTAYLYQ